MIEFFGQTFCFSIWKLLPNILEINLIIYLDFLSRIKLRSTLSFSIIKTSKHLASTQESFDLIHQLKNPSTISRPWKILFARINCFFHSSSLRGCENKTTIGTSKPYTGAMKGTMHKPQANLGADQKFSPNRFPATRS